MRFRVLVGVAVLGLVAGCAPSAELTESVPEGTAGTSSTTSTSATSPDTSTTTAATTSATSWTAPRTVPDGLGSGAADGVFPRTIAHFGGSTVVPAAPTRIVALSTGQLDGLLALDVVPTGTTRAQGADLIPAYLLRTHPDQKLSALADLGTRLEPDVEAVAAARPDLVLVNSTVDAGVRSQLEQIAPTVVTEGTGVNWKQDFLLLADGVGRTQQAQRFLDSFHADAAALGAGLPTDPTISLVRVTTDRTRMFGVASFAGSIVEDAGLTRPIAQQFTETSEDLSAERYDLATGDEIFLGVQAGADAATLTGSGLWRSLPAVRDDRVTTVDDDVWYLNAGPEAARLVLADLTATLS